MFEKWEECPVCASAQVSPIAKKNWLYDAQQCMVCGYGTPQGYAIQVRRAACHPYELVKEFHEKFNHPIAQQLCNMDDISIENQKLIELRQRLIDEEYYEFCDAMANNNEIEALDALCDLVYVIYGMALAMGWDINAAFAEVHRSNMSKLGADGKPVVREDGKILKGENYSPPNLAQFFARKK